MAAREYVGMKLAGNEHEVFALVTLDSQHRVIDYHEMFNGTIDSASVYPREVVKQALADNAGAVMLAHNHPSGIAKPSDADRLITRKLKDALELVDIRTIDHFIVGETITSLAERGMI
jgi:DNA repair protein RadC